MRTNPDEPDPPLLGLYVGVVTHRNDPDGLGRVRVRIPGVVEPASAWAWPLGATGGGTKDRGLWWIPDVGAEVGIFFKQGDVDHPYYLPANWGAPGGVKESPEASDEGDPDVRVLALGAYDVVVDTRDGTKKLRIVDKAAPDNVIEMDGKNRTLEIRSTVAIQIKSEGAVDIQGLVVTVNGVPAGLGKL